MDPLTDIAQASSTNILYSAKLGSELSDLQLSECAKLFSANYGIWGEAVIQMAPGLKPNTRVRMNAQKLKAQCFGAPEQTVLVTCHLNDTLIGHAFATTWDFEGGVTGWITQLVVDSQHRRHYIATSLLQTLTFHPLFQRVTVFGLASSHPAACNALAKIARLRMNEIDLAFIGANAPRVLASSTVGYIKTAELRGTAFGDARDPAVVSSVFTNFYVSHVEPLDILETYIARSNWSLGELLEGHEFLIIVPVSK